MNKEINENQPSNSDNPQKTDELVCPGRLPIDCGERGILEQWHPEIEKVGRTYFCFCPEECAPHKVLMSQLTHKVVYLPTSEINQLYPMDPFSPPRACCYRPLSRMCQIL